jgi:hypothetical protein
LAASDNVRARLEFEKRPSYKTSFYSMLEKGGQTNASLRPVTYDLTKVLIQLGIRTTENVAKILDLRGAKTSETHLLRCTSRVARLYCAAGPLSYGSDPVNGYVVETFEGAIRPADFQSVDLARRAQAEVHPHIAIGDVTGPAAHFVQEHSFPDSHSDSGSDRIMVGASTDELERNPVIGRAHIVDQQRWLRIHVADEYRKTSIVPKIAHR